MGEWLRRLPPAGRAVTIIVLAALGWFTWWWLSEQRAVTEVAKAPRQPDSYFQDLEIVRHNKQGRPEIRVKAAYAEHFRDEAWVHLRDLDAGGLDTGPDWRLTADHGRLDDDGVELEAWGDVVLTRRDQNGMRLETERLLLNTETEIAASEELVTIRQGAGTISGRGFRASLADDHLQLESSVEARYGK